MDPSDVPYTYSSVGIFGTLYSIKKENEVWIRERDKNGKWKYTLDREKKWYE